MLQLCAYGIGWYGVMAGIGVECGKQGDAGCVEYDADR
jgi:hypothetical protein